MYERRWPVIAAGLIGVLVVAVIGWMAGRASAPEGSAAASDGGAVAGAIRVVDGVPVGVEHTRAGALAAADSYVAVSSETVLQDADRYRTLVQEAFDTKYQAKALTEGEALRARSSSSIANYEAGGRALAIVAARRLDEYAGTRAKVTTWTAGVSWGPERRPGQRWFFTETSLRWDGGRWRVERIDESDSAAPTPAVVRYSKRSALSAEAFDRELRGMTAPAYGVQSP